LKKIQLGRIDQNSGHCQPWYPWLRRHADKLYPLVMGVSASQSPDPRWISLCPTRNEV
jgi:hypothetical protein